MRKIIAWIFFFGIFVGTSFWEGISFVEAAPRLAQVGRAYQFDGVDDYVDLGNFQLINDISIEFDVKTTDISNKVLFEIGGNTGISIQTDTSSTGKLLINNGSLLRSTSIISDGSIHNIRYERVGNANSLFIDGNLENSNTNVVSFSGGTATYIGGRGTSGNVNALIGNVVIKDGNGKILHSWHGDEGVGVRSFDAVQEWTDVEIASNGGFNTDVSGFTTSRCAVTWNSSGYATTTQNNVTSDNFAILKGGSHVVGKKYKITFRARSTDTTNTPAIISAHYSNIHLLKNPNLSSVWQEYEYTAIATQTVFILYPSITAVPNGTRVDLDNISIKELHSPVHGTIQNANEATFHTEDRDFMSYQNTIGYMEEVPQEELYDLSVASVLGSSATTTYSNEIRRITGNNTAVTGSTRTNGVLPNSLDLRTYKIAYDARSNTTVKITPDLVDDWPAIGDRPSVTSNFLRYEYFMTAQNPTESLDFVDWNVQKEEGGNLLATDYGEIRNASVREVSLPGQLIPRAIDKDGNALLTDIFGNYMDGSRRAAMSDADLYLAMPVAVFDGVDDIVETGQESNKTNPGTGDFTVSAVIETVNEGTHHTIAKKQSVYTAGWTFYFHTNGELGIYLGGPGGSYYSRSSSGHVPMGGFHEVAAVVKRAATTTIEFYVDGVLKQAVSTAVALGTITSDSPVIFASAANGGWLPFKGKMSEFRYYNRALTALEVADLPDNAQAHYTFSEGGGDTVYDKVPEYYAENIVVNSDFNTDTNWSKGTGWTISGGKAVATGVQSYERIYQTAPTNFFKVGSTYRVTINVSSINSGKFGFYLAGSGLPAQSENNISTAGSHIFIKKLDTVINQSLNIRGYPDVDGSIESIFIEELQKPAHGIVTNENLATFWANDDTSRSDNLLDGFGKGLYCSAPGTTYKPSNTSYGTWEFDMNKSADGNFITTQLISSNNVVFSENGYRVNFHSDESLQFSRRDAGVGNSLFRTAVAYITNNTDFKIKVVRNSATNEYVTGAVGTFAVYIKGGNFGEEYVLVSMVGGSGTNPITDNMYTTSNYFVADLDAKDTIGNLKINGVNVDMHQFINGTGSFQKVNIPAQDGNTGKDVFKNLLSQPTTVNSVVNRLRLSALNLVTVG
jgi:hypothetical protein